MAYVLIGIIALKLLLELPPFNIEIPNAAFAAIVFSVLGLTIAFHFVRVKKHGQKHL